MRSGWHMCDACSPAALYIMLHWKFAWCVTGNTSCELYDATPWIRPTCFTIFLYETLVAGHILQRPACCSWQRLQVCGRRRWCLRQVERWWSFGTVQVRLPLGARQVWSPTRPGSAEHLSLSTLCFRGGWGLSAPEGLFKAIPWASATGRGAHLQLSPEQNKVI